MIEKIKKLNPDMAFSSDFIVGYPGETDEDFQESLEVIEKVRFASSYSFKYSPRPGTPSSLKNNLIDTDVVDTRLKKMQSILNKYQREFNLTFIDKTVEVLFSGKGKKHNQYVGRTPHLQPVHVFSSRDIEGKLLKVKLESLTSYSFHGKLSA